MAAEFREFTSDEMSSMIPHFEGSTQPVSQKKKEVVETARAPLNTMQLPLNNTPVAPSPDVNAVTQSVTQANQQIQQGLPAPQAPSSVKELGKEVEQVGKSLGDTLMQNWLLPVGLAAYGAYKLLGEKTPSTIPPDNPPPPPKETKSIRDRMLLGEVREPSFESAPTEKPPVSPYSEAELKMLEQSEANRLAKQSEASMKQYQAAPVQAPAAPVQAAPAPVEPPAAVQPPVAEPVVTAEPVVQKEVTSSEPKESGSKKQPTTKVKKETAVVPLTRDANGKVVYPETMSPAARAGAEEFKKKYPKHAADLAKQELIGVMGFGSGDNNLYNTYGAEGRRAVLEYFQGGKPLGPYTQNYEPFMESVRKGIPPKDVPGLMSRLPAEAEAGNFGPLGTPASIGGKKGGLVTGSNQVTQALKLGGPALMLLGAAGAANAKEAARNLGESLLPWGITPGQLESGTLTPEIIAAQNRFMQERQKLGSPYRSVPPRQ